MNAILQKYLGKAVGRLGFRLVPLGQELPADISADAGFMTLYEKVRPFTMTSPERLYALYQSVHHVVRHGIQGDFVECGVWKGGSCMMMALTLERLGDTSRRIWLYDTFEGMSEPTEADKQITGESATSLLSQEDRADQTSVWCWSTIEEVRANVASTGFHPDRFVFSKGKVEDTIPASLPDTISLLRLDTDWYESTRHELLHLYPLLSAGGILIIDDFGHWEGAKKAVLEYFSGQDPFIHRVDYTGRLMIKP
jgi:hypothetical protein